jgi:hypothetical protein
MNDNRTIDFRTVVFVIFITAAFLAMPWLIRHKTHTNQPEPIGYERAQERATVLENVKTNGAAVLESYGWRNKDEGIVHIPITRAKELFVQESQDPAAVRKEMIARATKAFAPPPKQPAKPNPYE